MTERDIKKMNELFRDVQAQKRLDVFELKHVVEACIKGGNKKKAFSATLALKSVRTKGA